MRGQLLVWVLVVLVGVVVGQTPPSWGGNPRYAVKVRMLNDKPAVSWNFTYFYDWTLKAERYEHESPQEDEMCLLPVTVFKKDGEACTVTFATDGWSYIGFPAHNFCCRCSKSFGSVRYDWLKENSSYVGVETVSGRSVTHWTKQGQFLNHYYSTVDRQLPVKYFELKNGNPKAWDFDLESYSTAPIDPAKFQTQCSTPCVGQCSLLAQEDSNLQTD